MKALLLLLGFAASAQVAERDELPTASAESVGIDAAAIAKLTEDIRAGKYKNIHSLLILRSGKLVAEAYFQGEDERRGNRSALSASMPTHCTTCVP